MDSPDLESSSLAASQDLSASRASVRSPGGRGTRTIRRYGPQPTKLEGADDPLGPLGKPTQDEPPAPPQKEQIPPRGPARGPGSPTSSVSNMMDSVNLEDEDEAIPKGARRPPPVQPSAREGPQRQTQPSVSVEQAAKPTFIITVGDPHKVGGPTSSHTVYQVRTTVRSVAPISSARLTCLLRPPPKRTRTLISSSRDATVTSFGCTKLFTTTVPVS